VRTKLVLFAALVLWLGLGIYLAAETGSSYVRTEIAQIWSVATTLAAVPFLLFWLTADPHMPLRHWRRLARGRAARLFFYRIVRDGPSATALYFALLLGVASLTCTLLALAGGSVNDELLLCTVYTPALVLVYGTYLVAQAALVLRLVPRRRRSCATRRTLTLGLIVVHAVVLFVVVGLGSHGSFARFGNPLMALLPGPYLLSLESARSFPKQMASLVLPALVALAYVIAAFVMDTRALRRQEALLRHDVAGDAEGKGPGPEPAGPDEACTASLLEPGEG
jgi:hypothetical protein